MATKTKWAVIDFYKLGWDELNLAQRKKLVLDRGLEVASRYGDTFWTEAISGRRKGDLELAKWLVSQGQRVDAKTKRGTALHIAAECGNVDTVKWLLANGAKASIEQKHEGNTPLEYMLERLDNADAESAALIAPLLLRAGAKITPKVKKGAEHAYKEFDYYRTRMAPAFRKKCEAATRALCKLTGVTPPAPRLLHDGKARITVPEGTFAKQWAALWNYLVPPDGEAQTVQAEVIRVAGRLRLELDGNGGCNWGKFYRDMARAFPTYIRRGKRVAAKSLERADAIVKELDHQRVPQCDPMPLLKIAVEWVRNNPAPMKR